MEKQHGFSLLETAVSLALFTLIMVVLFTAFARALLTTKAADLRSDTLNSMRLAMSAVANDARIAAGASPSGSPTNQMTLSVLSSDRTQVVATVGYSCDDDQVAGAGSRHLKRAQTDLTKVPQTTVTSEIATWPIAENAPTCFAYSQDKHELSVQLQATLPRGLPLVLQSTYVLRNVNP